MRTTDLYRLLHADHLQAQGIVDTIGDPLLVLDAQLCVLAASRAFYSTFDVDSFATVGQPLGKLGNGQWDDPELERLLREVIPRATAIIDYQVEREFPGLGRRTMSLSARTLHHPDGGSHSMLLTIVDTTDRRREDQANALLFGELRHRMKNLMAVTKSIARLTRTEGRSAEAYRDAFLGRLNALVAAEDLAFSEGRSRQLRDLLALVLAPYGADGEGVVIEPGAAVDLTARQIRAVCLILHELATNAAKYGALSVPTGQVRVSWLVDRIGRELRLKWAERGGPPVTPPTTQGYGARFIRLTATQDLLGRLEQDFAPEGLRTEIVIPLG